MSDVVAYQDNEGTAMERLRSWFLTELAALLDQPGNVKITIHVNADRSDVKAITERFQQL